MFTHWFKTITLVAALAAGAEASSISSFLCQDAEESSFRKLSATSSPENSTRRGLRNLKKGKKEKSGKAGKKGKKGKSGKSSKREKYVKGNLVEVLNSNPDTTDLALILSIFGLESATAEDLEDLTVFASTNQAIAETDIPIEELKKFCPSPSRETYETIGPCVELDLTPEQGAILNNAIPAISSLLINQFVTGQILMAADISDGLTVQNDALLPLEFQVNDTGVFVNGVEIIDTDLEGTGFIAHVIDGNLLPAVGEILPGNPDACIFCNIQSDPNFELLFGLIISLAEPDPDTGVQWCTANIDTCVVPYLIPGAEGVDPGVNVTMFTPINSALALVVGPDPMAFSNQIGKALTNEILKNHVVEGVVLAQDLSDGQVLTSLAGNPLTISLGEGAFVTANPGPPAEIIAVDRASSNGVYHAINGILLPPPPPQ